MLSNHTLERQQRQAFMTIKVDVDTLRGTLEGVPSLLRTLDQFHTRATFLFSLGPDHTGRAIKRVFRPGFFSKVQRTSVVEHYGVRTLLYGTVLPGPDIGKRGADIMRSVRAAGHEVGIHTWDHVAWQDHVRERAEAWTHRQMQQAFDRFHDIFGVAPETHGAAGWQMNTHALRLLDDWNMRYASDCRDDGAGAGPFRPHLADDKVLRCVQMPTTLPTLDEMIGVDHMDASAVAHSILASTAKAERDEVYTLHAELEGAKLQPAFATLLAGWQQQGFQLGSMADYYAILDTSSLPTATLGWGSIAGRSGELMLRGAAALA